MMTLIDSAWPDLWSGRARQRDSGGAGWIAHMLRAGKKVDDELPVPVQSGFGTIEETEPVFEHQKVKPKG